MRAIIASLIFGFGFFLNSFATDSIYTDRDYVRIAEFFERDGACKKAAQYYKKALEVNPNNLSAIFFFAMENNKNGKYAKSLAYFQKLASENVRSSIVFFNIGVLLHKRFGRVHEAINEYKKSIGLGFNFKDVHFLLRNAYLQIGDFQNACRQEDILDTFSSKTTENLWDGSDLRGKTVLLRNDKGIGDLFMWLRYVRDFKQQGAYVVVQARKSLFPLLSQCGYIDKLLPQNVRCAGIDFQIPVSKAQYLLNKSIESFYTEIPYMYAHSKLVKHWAKKLAGDTSFKIGICWDPCSSYVSAKTGSPVKNERALPLCFFEPLSRIKGVRLYSLQQVNGTEQIKDASSDFQLHMFDENFDKTYGSFSDTAAVMKNLDLIITVDTSIAHLAGALGVPVWVVLPFYSAWRWLLKRPDTPWYPTMRLFRQDSPHDWESAMEKVYDELVKIVSKG